MALQFFATSASSPSTAVAGLFIPQDNLDGVLATEFGAGVSTAIKTSKAFAGILNTIDRIVNAMDNPLSITPSQGSPTGTGSGLITIQYTGSVDYVLNIETMEIEFVPAPATGTYSGQGAIAIADIFPDAEIVTATGAISGEGLLIPWADLATLGVTTTPSNIAVGQDNRNILAALYKYIQTVATIRATGIVSAITATSEGNITRKIVPTDWTDATNPRANVSTAWLKTHKLVTVPYNITIEYLMNQQTQAFEVNVA